MVSETDENGVPKPTSLHSLQSIVDSIERGRATAANNANNANVSNSSSNTAPTTGRKEHQQNSQQQVSKSLGTTPATTMTEFKQFTGNVVNSSQTPSLETPSSSSWAVLKMFAWTLTLPREISLL